MNNRTPRFRLSILLLFVPLLVSAQDVICVFKVGSDICEPVTLKTSDGTYQVRGSVTFDKSISRFEAYDCQGRQIVNPIASTYLRTGQPTIRTYELKTLYEPESGRSSYDDSGDGWREVQETTDRVVESTMTNIGDHMSSMANEGIMIPAAGYPNLTLNLGLSRMYGEFARLKACLGDAGGYLLYGGVGKDWIFNGKNKEKLAWHVGVGYYGVWGYDDEQEFNLGITFSETPVCPGYALSMDLLYNYYFGRSTRFGLFGGLGLGVGDLRSVFTSTGNEFGGKFVWEVTLGIAVKLLADD